MNRTLRKLIRQRAGNCCEYCKAQDNFSPDPFSIEHIIPVSKGGSDEPDNLAWACFGCNGCKYNAVTAIDPATGMVVSLFNPRVDGWDDHFIWSTNHTLILGKTPKGRATIQKLQLNRPGLVNLRAVLKSAGKHPPG